MYRCALVFLTVTFWSADVAKSQPNIPATSEAGYEFVKRHGMEFAWIPKELGTQRKNDRKGISRTLKRGEGHFMGRFEVTQGDWHRILGEAFDDYLREAENGSKHLASRNLSPTKPTFFLDYKTAERFVDKLNELEKQSDYDKRWIFSIPSEKEWEYAARAGVRSDYLTGKVLMPHAAAFSFSLVGLDRKKLPDEWFKELRMYDNLDSPCVVGSRSIPNYFGLYDVHGNVSEITSTLATDASESMPATRNPVVHVKKGGAWCVSMEACTFKFKGWAGEQLGRSWTGLRVMAHEVEKVAGENN